jgi:hypothetical protein
MNRFTMLIALNLFSASFAFAATDNTTASTPSAPAAATPAPAAAAPATSAAPAPAASHPAAPATSGASSSAGSTSSAPHHSHDGGGTGNGGAGNGGAGNGGTGNGGTGDHHDGHDDSGTKHHHDSGGDTTGSAIDPNCSNLILSQGYLAGSPGCGTSVSSYPSAIISNGYYTYPPGTSYAQNGQWFVCNGPLVYDTWNGLVTCEIPVAAAPDSVAANTHTAFEEPASPPGPDSSLSSDSSAKLRSDSDMY